MACAQIVSIHTRHYWRVKPSLAAAPQGTTRFNPHPPLLAGETMGALAGGDGVDVSIHTRHYWRVKLLSSKPRRLTRGFNPHPPLLAGETGQHNARWRVKTSFNPHPPLLAGETRVAACRALGWEVSIHTRHYWRVKLSIERGPIGGMVFQSTPAITGG